LKLATLHSGAAQGYATAWSLPEVGAERRGIELIDQRVVQG
jgi:hypothetical protein